MAGKSGQASEKQRGRGGKLAVIAVLAILLGSGGFFAAKNAVGPGFGSASVELGQIHELDEFLVNLSDGPNYLRARVALHMRDGVSVEQAREHLPAIRDAILMSLTAKSLQDVQSIEGKKRLKREIAAAVNGVLGTGMGRPLQPQVQPAKHPDWDSQTGPVLKVYLTDFATQ